MKQTIGGNRLGSGKKMSEEMHGFSRSTHDLSYIWRNTQAPGTLVPFMCEVGLPGDTFDIDLNASVLTHPTVGPLYGSYKVQLDVFTIPMRLYMRELTLNMTKIGLNMSQIRLPQLIVEANSKTSKPEEQINPSSILAYLGIRGIGRATDPNNVTTIKRAFSSTPFIGYWDIVKNYYANQQEEKGAVIHKEMLGNVTYFLVQMDMTGGDPIIIPQGFSVTDINVTSAYRLQLWFNDDFEDEALAKKRNIEDNTVLIGRDGIGYRILDLFEEGGVGGGGDEWVYQSGKPKQNITLQGYTYESKKLVYVAPQAPTVRMFDLSEIDDMRRSILVQDTRIAPYVISKAGDDVQNLPFAEGSDATFAYQYPQEGLALKTYQNDIFNNWLATEWITNINSITSVSTAGDEFTIDAINLANKVYQMLTRIAMSGGTYYDYLETSYDEKIWRQSSTPVYVGGLSKELIFQEVVATTSAETSEGNQVLGQLGGRGVLSKKHKGGNITVRINEPSYVMGIVSITPRVDYSQGNRWDTNLKTMDDFHKPGLDQIGFQDLITDKMATFDTEIVNGSLPLVTMPTFKSAGKQPAWIDYMTNFNRTYGNFAIEDNEMFMTLNRKYEQDEVTKGIQDLTSYIDPVKYNFIFAETARDAMNFWVQISNDITARRKMSAKIMPNL